MLLFITIFFYKIEIGESYTAIAKEFEWNYPAKILIWIIEIEFLLWIYPAL